MPFNQIFCAVLSLASSMCLEFLQHVTILTSFFHMVSCPMFLVVLHCSSVLFSLAFFIDSLNLNVYSTGSVFCFHLLSHTTATLLSLQGGLYGADVLRPLSWLTPVSVASQTQCVQNTRCPFCQLTRFLTGFSVAAQVLKAEPTGSLKNRFSFPCQFFTSC